MQHIMAVTGYDSAALSVFSGNSKWEWQEVEADPDYQADLIDREIAFWRSVESGAAPPRMTKANAPVAETLKVLDLSASNEWCSAAQDYLTNLPALKACDDAKTQLKKLVPADVWKASGGGLIAKRDKRGALRFTEVV